MIVGRSEIVGVRPDLAEAWDAVADSFPVHVTRSFWSRIVGADPTDPLADADIPFNMGHVAVTATASASDRLGYYYDLSPADAASTPVAVAAAKRLAALPNPFELAEVARAFESSDLLALEMAPQGKTELKVTIGLGADFELAKGISGKFDLAVDARVSLAGQYALTLRKLPRLPGQAFQDRRRSGCSAS